MSMRSNVTDAARRAQTSIARCTIRGCDDGHDMMQVKQADVMYSETPTDFERWQTVGFTAYPKDQQQDQAPTPQQGQQGQQGGDALSGFNQNQPKGPAAEGVMLYVGGSRSHPVCAAIDDRRVRPYGMQQGESAHYACDGSGQMLYHRLRGDANDGVYLLTCDLQQGSGSTREPIDLVTYNGVARDAQGRVLRNKDGSERQSSTRFVSIRHVNKQKQPRNSQALNTGQGGSRDVLNVASNGSNYKHEGDSVNTETRWTNNQIQFFDGSASIGYYDRTKKQWNLNIAGKGSVIADQNHAHIVFGDNQIWVDKGGCYSSLPLVIKPDPYDKQ
ncbi:MAG: phage baseplate assembly protein [Rhizobiales bacterium]|nr:phage baseplate assembly protein [Hyphomicrobiales bacterium]